MNHRYEFVYLFDCADGNPNGDPDLANAPRVDPQDMHGLVSDVCLKRKIRNYVQIAGSEIEGFDIFIRDGAILNDRIDQIHDSLGHGLQSGARASRDQALAAQVEMARRFFDVRTFGAVMSTGAGAGRIRGPVQIGFSRSVDPVLPLDLSITRVAVAKIENESSPIQTMGRKGLIPYGLFRCHGFISAHLARQTGFSDKDIEMLWSALKNMFDIDRSASRGAMNAQRLFVFRHSTPLGNAPAHKLFDLINIALKPSLKHSAKPPRRFADYETAIDRSQLPRHVELLELF